MRGYKESGNYYSISGIYRDSGNENGNYYSILGVCRNNGKKMETIGILEKTMETTVVYWGYIQMYIYIYIHMYIYIYI